MTSFINSQFQYFPLIWIFHSRKLNTKINKLHERTLRITYRDRKSSFEDLLGHDNSVSVHQKNVQLLMIEMLKTKHGLNPSFMNEIFCPQTNQYSLRNDCVFKSPKMRSITYGSETVRFRGPQLWCTLPPSIRLSTNMAEFKAKIKVWKDDQSLEGYLAFMTCFLYYELSWHFLLNYIYTCTFYANFINKVVIITMIIIIMMMMIIIIIIFF